MECFINILFYSERKFRKDNLYALLTKLVRSRWLDIGQVLFFFFAFVWTETKSRSIKTQKRTWPISSHLDRTSLVNKGFIIWPKDYANRNFALVGPTRAIPSWQDRPILPAWVANQNTGFASSCPLAEPAI